MIIFTILFMVLLVSAIGGKTAYKKAVAEKKNIDYALQMSVDSAAEQLAAAYQNTNLSDYLISASNEFFNSLAAGLNLYEDEDERIGLSFFTPALLVTCNDGFYVNYLAEVKQDGATVFERVWTECQPYTYSDNYFIYRFFLDDRVIIYEKEDGAKTDGTVAEVFNDDRLMSVLSDGNVFISQDGYNEYKKAAIAESIAVVLERMVNGHSRIAGQMGISMVYGVPDFLASYTPAQEYPSFIAVFQGYPLTADSKIIYNGVSTSAAYISTVRRYTVELSVGPAQPFSVYHKDGCVRIGTYGSVLTDRFTSKQAITLYGCYACPDCFDENDGLAILP